MGIAWVIGAAMLTLAPALHHGLSLGPYDILSRSGLTQQPGAALRNSAAGDQIAQMIPWSNLAWTQVHQGHIPLWNPFNGLGLPLAFNWQSAVFSLPTAIGYAFPLHLAYTVQVVTTLVIAGTGAYALARVLGVGVIGCATAGTIFELSGSFMGWLGWPHAAVMSWAGWLFALAILIVRGQHRTRNVVAFAVLLALALVSGQPEIFTMLVLSIVVLVVTMVIIRRRTTKNRRATLRPLGDLSVAVVAGVALGAPLALPGVQVLARSTRNSGTLLAQTEVGRALPPHDLMHLFAQGYNGLPVAGSHVFADAVYFDTATYVGVIGIALAILGVVRGWRRPGIASFGVLGIVTMVIVFAPPFEALVLHLPLVQAIDWHRDLMTLGLCVAVLAGAGMDVVVRGSSKKSTQLTLAGLFAGFLILLLAVWFAGVTGLSPIDARLRRDSLIWPLVTAGVGLAVVGVLAVLTSRWETAPDGQGDQGSSESVPTGAPRGVRSPTIQRWRIPMAALGRAAGGLLLLLETAFLIASGAQLWSSAPHGIGRNPDVTALSTAIGSSTVGFGAFTCYAGPGLTALGILPEANILYGVHEFDLYDALLPNAYVQSWSEVSASQAGVPIYNSFCPEVTTASQARRFGIGFVLEPEGAAGPTGAVFDRTIGNESLYRIPDSGEATLTPVTETGGLPPADALGTPLTVKHPSPSSWKITTASQSAQVLRLRLTDEPGWRATIDGRPLPLATYAGAMMQARIPAGHHVIELNYWPPLFTLGLVIAGTCAVILSVASVVAVARRRNGHRHLLLVPPSRKPTTSNDPSGSEGR